MKLGLQRGNPITVPTKLKNYVNLVSGSHQDKKTANELKKVIVDDGTLYDGINIFYVLFVNI